MRAMPSNKPQTDAKIKASNQVIAGYTVAALGLIALLTINGVSGVPTAVVIGTAVLVAIGLLLPAAGMLKLRQTVKPNRSAARYGLLLQGLGLIGLLFAVLPLAVSASLSSLFVVSAILIATSAALALRGAFLVRGHYADIGASNKRGADYLIVGSTIIFSGVAVILGSNVAKYFFLSDVGDNVFTDVGAAISACGCVIAAYSFVHLQARSSATLGEQWPASPLTSPSPSRPRPR